MRRHACCAGTPSPHALPQSATSTHTFPSSHPVFHSLSLAASPPSPSPPTTSRSRRPACSTPWCGRPSAEQLRARALPPLRRRLLEGSGLPVCHSESFPQARAVFCRLCCHRRCDHFTSSVTVTTQPSRPSPVLPHSFRKSIPLLSSLSFTKSTLRFYSTGSGSRGLLALACLQPRAVDSPTYLSERVKNVVTCGCFY